MNEFNIILENYNNFFPCLTTIESSKNLFKSINHALIFSFLLGYFTKKKICSSDLNIILNKYKEKNFNQNDFSVDFKNIAYSFCEYFEKKEQQSSVVNNINNINVINVNINNNDINLNKSNTNNNNNKNNGINKDTIKSDVSKNQNLNSNNYPNFNFDNNYFNSNSNFNLFNNNDNNNKGNKNNNNNFSNVNEYQYQNKNDIDADFEYAKALELQEKADFDYIMKEDEKSQTKKCEICLEEFSLLDITNYFLNCNCILHNVCFDNMVKAAVESNNLPLKCPNCKIPVHPNFIEDSLRNANPQLFEKYEHFSMNNFLLNNNDEYSSCPTPGCEYMFFFNPGEHNFLCPLCNKNYCLNCKDEWHRGMTCQQYKDSRDVNKLDNQFFQFVKGAKFKMCPRCKYWVEKNQGCNHMKCRCGADFCYLCGQFMDMSKRHICKKNY